jgi:hypothetical protein
MAAVEADVMPPGDDFVPVEHRWLGLDKRAMPLTFVIVAIILVMTVVVPAIDQALSWDDEVRAGDLISMGEGVTFAPPVGWELSDGIRVGREPSTGVRGDSSATVAEGGVVVRVNQSGFDGSSDTLLDQVNRLRDRSNADENRAFKVTGPRQTVTTDSGLTGVSETFTSASGDGRLYAFVVDAGDGGSTPVGITITVEATADQYGADASTIDALVASLTYKAPAS